MATKPKTQAVEPITPPELPPVADIVTNAIAFDLEEQIAEELLDNIDWSKVRSAILKKAPQKLFAWLTSSNNTPINLSPFPELAALPSRDDDRESAA